jgi:DNA (cytosine-5)-methyltransferase 1
VSDIANTIDTGMQQHTLTEDYRIRRLTPLECERLMGFPDGWTDVEGMSDTQRYKQCGNGVVVNVVRDIAERMLKTEHGE